MVGEANEGIVGDETDCKVDWCLSSGSSKSSSSLVPGFSELRIASVFFWSLLKAAVMLLVIGAL